MKVTHNHRPMLNLLILLITVTTLPLTSAKQRLIARNVAYDSPTSLEDYSVQHDHEESHSLHRRSTTQDVPIHFPQNVASGDPTSDSVILWTRAAPKHAFVNRVYLRLIIGTKITTNSVLDRRAQIREDSIVQEIEVVTSPEVDYTVKVEVKDLKPYTYYFYQFVSMDGSSKTLLSRTKTLPADDSKLRKGQIKFAVVSCANWVHGYFWAYYKIAKRNDLDFILHDGDYIYEYANGEYGDGTKLGRLPKPDKRLATLEDYRTRQAQYKTDEHLRVLHRLYPFFNSWDDHEVVDNSWTNGSSFALNEVPFEKLKYNGMRAFFEYQPVRNVSENDEYRIYRTFRVGKLFDLIMIDTRFHGRDDNTIKGKAMKEEDRTIMGWDQEKWFKRELQKSKARGAKYRFICNQVVFAPQWGPLSYRNIDGWDGYPANRKRVIDFIKDNDIKNVIFLTGDVHSSWVHDIPYHPKKGYDRKNRKGSYATEFVGPSVTSTFAFEELRLTALKGAGQLAVKKKNLVWSDLTNHGYMLITVNATQTNVQYWFVDSVKKREEPNEDNYAEFNVFDGIPHVFKFNKRRGPGFIKSTVWTVKELGKNIGANLAFGWKKLKGVFNDKDD